MRKLSCVLFVIALAALFVIYGCGGSEESVQRITVDNSLTKDIQVVFVNSSSYTDNSPMPKDRVLTTVYIDNNPIATSLEGEEKINVNFKVEKGRVYSFFVRSMLDNEVSVPSNIIYKSF